MRFEPLGDTAVLVRLGDTIDAGALRLVRAACARIESAAIAGVLELVPAFNTIAVHYDPARFDGDDPYAALVALLEPRLTNLDIIALPAPHLVEIPVVYGGPAGPDLALVAAHAGMTPDDVARIHAAGDYLVHMVGFAPGFPYLGGLDPRLACPRRATPRTAVPAGSVGIGGSQTGIYPLESPGGWQIIGRTPLVLFDAAREPAALLRPGDHVRFQPVSADEATR